MLSPISQKIERWGFVFWRVLMKRLSGKIRLAILVSVIWVVFWWISPLSEFRYFFIIGVYPLALIWGVWWVVLGFKKDKAEGSNK